MHVLRTVAHYTVLFHTMIVLDTFSHMAMFSGNNYYRKMQVFDCNIKVEIIRFI